MKLFSDPEKSQIQQDALRVAGKPDDPRHNHNVQELLMALQIILHVLGKEWYERAGKEMNASFDVQTLSRNNQSPISYYLGSGDPSKFIRLIAFAVFLKNLLGKTNIQTKLRAYAKENRKKDQVIPIDKFDSTYFELKVANYFLNGGFRVEFIKELRNEQTPDLRITSSSGSTLVECKKKRSKNSYSVSNITDTIHVANNQLESFNATGIIAIEISTNNQLIEKEITELKHEIGIIISSMPKVMLIWILNEYIFLDTLTDEQVIRTEEFHVVNPNSERCIPEDIMTVILGTNPTEQRSLYED
ncbi:MAG: hypothetical protein KGI10_01300 [Thaumarchaeota archaeon]|nr:hypothetical protein [Nitrososphaerota archaeon]